ncbi:MAG: hypothetical protein HGA65_11300, partial [Oscillochloris sp.]|nr:hypothetical protein [Oscillochloris sp.]
TPPPGRARAAAVHPYYQQLVGRPGALLEIPPARYKYSLPQLAQITHGRPIFGGYLARSPDYPLPEEAPVLSALWRVDLPADPLMIEGMDDPLVPLNYYGVGDLVVHWDKIYPEQRALIPQLIERVLPGVTPEYQDATISVYHVPSATPQPFAGIVGEGWYPAESDGAHSWRWMGASGAILIVNPTSAALPVTLSLGAYGYGGSREVALSFDDDPAGLWQVEAGETTAALHLWLAPGSHRLTLQARADQESVANSSRALSIALLDARITIAAAAEAVSEQADHR